MMLDVIQGTPEWHSARLGKVTASKIADLMAKTRNGWGASRATYMAQLITERLTGNPTDSFVNAAMAWGTEQEPNARAAYSFLRDVDVEQVGFADHASIDMAGASPDGLVSDDGLVEIKCPNTSTHLDTLLGGATPDKYIKQMQWQMACTGRAWCDWVSYDPRLPGHLQIVVRRIERDDKLIDEIEEAVAEFLAEMDDKIARLQKLEAA